jgi:hypothetical protein
MGRFSILGASVLMAITLVATPAMAGPLDPPGPPAPTGIAGLPTSTPITAVPVTLEESGVYHLTQGFTVSDPSAHAIAVLADGVEIDLGGFTLIGPGMGTGRGVSAEAAERVTVRNGRIRDFGDTGVHLGREGIAEDLRIERCPIGLTLSGRGSARRVGVLDSETRGIQHVGPGELIDCNVAICGEGIVSAVGTAITRCSVFQSFSFGFSVIGPTVVRDCTAAFIIGEGFRGTAGTIFENCSSQGMAVGILGDDGVTIRRCTARNASVEGIAVEGAFGSSFIGDCHVDDVPIGIRVDQAATVSRNYVNNASTVGIQISAAFVNVTDNVLIGAPSGIQHTGTGVDCLYRRNIFTGGASLGAMSTFGPFVSVFSGDIAGDPDGDNPWANIQH